jgi:hypothetical protein
MFDRKKSDRSTDQGTGESMRKLVVSEWMALDGIFDADTMDQWFHPYQSNDRAEYIQEGVLGSDIFLFGRVTYEMLAPFWSQAKKNEMGIADKMNSMAKYVVSSAPLTVLSTWRENRRAFLKRREKGEDTLHPDATCLLSCRDGVSVHWHPFAQISNTPVEAFQRSG